MKDVEAYLGNGSAACAVDKRLRNAVGDGAAGQRLPAETPVIIVAHSLGSMVTYKNLMNRLADTQRPVYLVTIGSMLGARVVQQTLLGSHAAFPAKVPLPVKAWWNVVNTQDRLAFPAAPAFASNFPAKRPRDIRLDLGGPDAHSVTRYLSTLSGGRAISRRGALHRQVMPDASRNELLCCFFQVETCWRFTAVRQPLQKASNPNLNLRANPLTRAGPYSHHSIHSEAWRSPSLRPH